MKSSEFLIRTFHEKIWCLIVIDSREFTLIISSMSPALEQIEKQAFTLSAAEREILANHLYQSIHPKLTEIDHAWLDLAEKRFEDYQAGKSQGLSESEFFDSIEKELGWN